MLICYVCTENHLEIKVVFWKIIWSSLLSLRSLRQGLCKLLFTIVRCNFITLVLKRSHVPIQNLHSQLNYRWGRENAFLVLIITYTFSALLSLIKLNICRCNTCSTSRCQCHNNGLTYTDTCKCRKHRRKRWQWIKWGFWVVLVLKMLLLFEFTLILFCPYVMVSR